MVQLTLDLISAESTPEKLVGDKAYDSDPLDEALAALGIEMIAPHRRNRKPENRTQDGRKLKRYQRRWIVERTIAWMQNYRRILVRHEKLFNVYKTFTMLACLMIIFKKTVLFI
jgi:transposase